ncbi:hypothetical protein HOLleu_25508 [Holothuria leucospilota]|uniref:Uncharacterized protein n=1 Tax=Holothuria leucospilota TaxID=206669 RepID=A0A9Q1BT45_HOLLE|nr:hypothetical protein HOLleu_25508 [Holothuria leucospilota]
MEYLDAQDERERAELEVRMWQEETSGYPSLKEEFIKPQWTSGGTTGQVPKNLYASMYNVGHGTHNDPINVKIGKGNDKSEIKRPLAAVRNDAPEPISQSLNAGNDEAKCSKVPESDMTRLFQSISLSMNIPKPELISFDGDPAAYWGFINSFDTNIALRVPDDRSKLTYLIQFCKGKAKQSIENCVLMDAAAGYKKAREILYDQFGQPHNVTHALIGKILNREPIKPNDGQNLSDLARQMRTCEITLNQLGYVANMNSTDTLLKIQQLLPIYLQSEWAKKAHSMTKNKVEPNFTHMTEFLEQAAHIASNMYGQNIRKNSKNMDKTVKGRRTKSSANPPSKVTTLATQIVNSSTCGKENCILCRKAHRLTCLQLAKNLRRVLLRRDVKL